MPIYLRRKEREKKRRKLLNEVEKKEENRREKKKPSSSDFPDCLGGGHQEVSRDFQRRVHFCCCEKLALQVAAVTGGLML